MLYSVSEVGFLMPATSRALTQILEKLEAAKHASGHVLLTGESGVGKDYLARYLYRACSLRAIAVMFAGDAAGPLRIPSHLRWLHLRNLEELSADHQLELLSTLHSHKNLRVVATAGPSLFHLVRTGGFRADLYHRLSRCHLMVPPLRERRTDVARLVEEFATEWSKRMNLSKIFAPSAVRHLETLHWPGNASQLKNVVFHALGETETTKVGGQLVRSLDLPFLESSREFYSLKKRLEKAKKDHIVSVLRQSRSLRQAARFLEISPQSLLRAMSALNIDHSLQKE